ncbi:synaptotagmin-3-like isoform X3 [Herrania umbratica]|uniref:Synaptotagmin-3-like isoform X3 n=1 Tax=Herrania umbratica TaxID=108875 RepID=A0A6J1ART6_9ROSI|nr:synaptotagmin-3-like isoform X3 [Herrania umbratica]
MMGLVGCLLGIIGFGIGVPIGILIGFLLFIYKEPADVKDPIIRPLHDLDTSSLLDILPEIPSWMKHPDYDRLLDVQICAAPRIALKPLVPTFPCFTRISMSLMEKEMISKQIASLYLWPQTLEIPILDGSVGATKKPVGILHVKVVRALKLLKMDLLGSSDPYVKLSLSGERLPAKKTSIKMRNLNPLWNEDFKLTVKDPQSQVLQLHVYDWEKVGTHDKLGMQVVPLRLLAPHETQEFSLDLVKNTNPNDPQNKKPRGQLVVQMTFNPFKEDYERFSGPLDRYASNESGVGRLPKHDGSICGAGLLSVILQRAEGVEGKYHNNPYAVIIFKGEKKKSKLVKRTRDPCWNEEFQFVLEEAPLKDMIHIEVISKRLHFSLLRRKESLGHVDINLNDVVHNGRINEKYDLINSKNGVICIEIRWEVT